MAEKLLGQGDLDIRTARKSHDCHAHEVFKIWGRPTRCSGRIEKGERYYDDRRVGWEILRYHVRCGAYGALPDEEPAKEPEK